MLLTNFNSIFELLAAFNFAYVISDKFNEHLHTRIIHGFVNVIKNLKNIGGKIDIGEDTLHGFVAFETDDGKSPQGRIDKVKDEMKKFRAEFEVIESEIIENIKIAGLRESFKYICLYSALYCLSILGYAGFVDEWDSDNNSIIFQALGILNFFFVLFLSVALKKEKILFNGKRAPSKKDPRWYNNIGYRLTFFWFIVSFILSFSYYLLDKLVLGLYCTWPGLHLTTVILCVLLPSIHFVLYFVKAYRNVVKLSPIYAGQANTFETKWNDFYKEKVESLRHLLVGFEQLNDQGGILCISPYGSQWKVHWENRHSSNIHAKKSDAINEAKRMVAALAPGQASSIRVQTPHGTFHTEWSFAKDPFPPIQA